MAETKIPLVEWLDDLCVRFIINLPQEELASVERICFQIEEAQWFYEDFIRPLDPSLPSLSLRDFSLAIFQHCPLFAGFSQDHHLLAFSEFLAYKTRVPVRGAIMLDETMNYVLLVKGWKKGANWSFPRGKINKDERDLDCAVREVFEETGFDLNAAGLTTDESRMKHIDVTMREQHMKLYIFRGVSTETRFQPRTRKEISKIQWWRLDTLPGYNKKRAVKQGEDDQAISANKLYMVAPFLGPLKKWIARQRKEDSRNGHVVAYDSAISAGDELVTDGDTAAEEMSSRAALGVTNTLAQSSNDWIRNTDLTDSQYLKDDSNQMTGTPQSILDATAQLKASLGIDHFQHSSSAPRREKSGSTDLLAMLRKDMKSMTVRSSNTVDPNERHSYAPSHEYHQLLQLIDAPQHQGRDIASSSVDSQPQMSLPNSQHHQSHMKPQSQYTAPSRESKFSEHEYDPFSLHFNDKPEDPQAQQDPSRHPPNPMLSKQFHSGHVPGVSDILSTSFPNRQNYSSLYNSSSTQSRPPVVPVASSPSQLNLNSHAMKLLETLKGASNPPIPSDITDSSQASQAPMLSKYSTLQAREIEHSFPRRESQQSRRSSTAQSFRGLVPSSVITPTIKKQTSRRNSPAEPQLETQKDVLLKLFQNPVHPTASPAHPQAIQVTHASPIELSAVASPKSPRVAQIAEEKALSTARPISKELAPSSIPPKILQRPTSAKKQASPALISTALPVHHNEPDVNIHRRKNRPAKVEGRSEEAKSRRPVTPVQILKRPTEQKSQQTTPRAVEASSSKSPSPKTDKVNSSTNKVFQPQILKRPQQAIKSLHSDQSIHDLRTREEPSTSHQKTLLSLLGNAEPQQPVQVPELPRADPNDFNQSSLTAKSTITSPTAKASSVTASNNMSSHPKIGSVASASHERGEGHIPTQSPLSPADRSFLLSYLGDVVSGASR